MSLMLFLVYGYHIGFHMSAYLMVGKIQVILFLGKQEMKDETPIINFQSI